MKIVRENIGFKRGEDPHSKLGIGEIAKIEQWFATYAPDTNYTIDKYMNIEVNGNLDLYGTDVKSLPDNLSVYGTLDISNTSLTEADFPPTLYADDLSSDWMDLSYNWRVEDGVAERNSDNFFDYSDEEYDELDESINFTRGEDPIDALGIGKYFKDDCVKCKQDILWHDNKWIPHKLEAWQAGIEKGQMFVITDDAYDFEPYGIKNGYQLSNTYVISYKDIRKYFEKCEDR